MDDASIGAISKGLLIAGVEIDATSDVPVDKEIRLPRFYLAGSGAIDLPRRPMSRPPFEIPVPITTVGDRWGVLWVEAQPSDGASSWLRTQFTRLWFAEHSDSAGWSAPRLIASAKLGMSWSDNRTLLYAPGGEPYLVIVAEDDLAHSRVVFGPAMSALNNVDVGEMFSARAATVTIGRNDEMILAVLGQLENQPAGRQAVRILRSLDRGNHWSKPEEIWTGSGKSWPLRLRAHVTVDGDQHIVWRDQDDNLFHLWKSYSGAWTRVRFSTVADPTIADSFTGIDKCGRLTVFVSTIVPPGTRALYSSSWQAGRWSDFVKHPAENAAFLFDGLGYDNTWYLGWMEPKLPLRDADGFTFRGVVITP